MGSPVWHEMRVRLEEAYRNRRCYVPANAQEARVLRRHAIKGEVVEPFWRMFMLASRWSTLRRDERERFIINAVAHPQAVFCSTSAVVMHGISVSYERLGTIHLLSDHDVPKQGATAVARHRGHRQGVERVDGVLVTPLMPSGVDAMRGGSFPDGLVVADALLCRLGITRSALMEAVERLARRRKGVEVARRAAVYADARVESGGESYARAVMIQDGIVPTDLQRTYRDPLDVRSTFRPDFVFELVSGKTVLGELDGKVKYVDEDMLGGRDSLDVLLDERQRESRLTMLDMPVVRFRMKDVLTPGRIATLFAAAGVTPKTLVQGDYRSVGGSPL